MNVPIDRYQRAFDWLLRCASAYPGIRATASIGELRLSCWLTGTELKIHSRYVHHNKEHHYDNSA